jgi:hypothetical protein
VLVINLTEGAISVMSAKKTIGYVSAIDEKLAVFNAKNPRSEAQQAEFQKYQRIGRLRDRRAVQPATL